MRHLALLTLLMALALGCKNQAAAVGQAQSPQDQIRTAIDAHLAHQGSLNVHAFDTDVKQVSIQGDHAQAQVEFRVKGGPGVMQLTYALEQRDGAWSVVESDPVGSNFSHPALDQGQSSSTDVPSATLPGATHSLADTLRSFKAGAAPVTR